jgi:hypothetical protein
MRLVVVSISALKRIGPSMIYNTQIRELCLQVVSSPDDPWVDSSVPSHQHPSRFKVIFNKDYPGTFKSHHRILEIFETCGVFFDD